MEDLQPLQKKLDNKQPSNIEADQALIGSILVNNDIIDEVSTIVKPSIFYDPAHTKIYEVIENLNNKGMIANPITLKNYFENEKDEIPESMLVGAVSIMIESLFNLENYEKIIELSTTTDKYLINNKAFEEVLAISYLYIGASYVNLSNLETGLFYLTRSKRMSKNEGQIKYIENFINNVTNYL